MGANMFQAVTDSLVNKLTAIQAGEASAQWIKPWAGSAMPEMPHNQLTGSPYHGLNVLTLYMTAIDRGYRTNQWMTFKQKNDFNSKFECELKIIKGEHGYPIYKFAEWVPKDFEPRVVDNTYLNMRTGDVVTRDQVKRVAMRKYTVFNIDQMEGVPDNLIPSGEPDWELRYSEAQAFAETLPCEVKHGKLNRAYYNPGRHFIMMPDRDQFDDHAKYLGTLFHEHIHSTGQALERDMSGEMGSESYAREELVAEIGSAMLCMRFGLGSDLQHPEYINMYMRGIKESDRAFWAAASKAQKAVDYLLNYHLNN